jgi:hypothetical protein
MTTILQLDVGLRDLAPVLQVAIGPVVVISGVGLLVLSMTNRLGRIVDRARALVRERDAAPAVVQGQIVAQLRILQRRAHLVRFAVSHATLCILLIALLIAVLFLAPLFDLEGARLASILFSLSMGTLIASLIAFLREVHVSLSALDIEVEAAMRGDALPAARAPRAPEG